MNAQTQEHQDHGSAIGLVTGTLIVVALTALVASPASAQDRGRAPLLPAVVEEVLLDPTTYAPAILSWEATRLDWGSSQVFFQNGWVEQNPRFTVSGQSHDTAMGYGAGNREILAEAAANLRLSLVNNVTDRVIEHMLARWQPNHPKLIRAIGWIERTAVASYLSYQLSSEHLSQWEWNEQRAHQLGYN
jgi:hypothetical protein